MQVAIVISRIFDDTASLARAAARRPGTSVVLVRGDLHPLDALRALRFAQRLWLEGAGPLLDHLVERGGYGLPGACLRVTDAEAASLPFDRLGRVVSDLIVSEAAAERVSAALAAGGQSVPRVHVLAPDLRQQILERALPVDAADGLLEIFLKPPGDLPRQVWESVAILGDLCRGQVAILGSPPPDLARHLATGCGLDVATGPDALSSADSIVHWPEHRHYLTLADLARDAPCLRRGGLVAAVAASATHDQGGTLADTRNVFQTAFRGETGTIVGVSGNVVFATGRSGTGTAKPLPRRRQGPLVSAVVPVYNDAARVGRALASLRAQTYENLEILVIDDGSTDQTARAVEKHLDDPRVRYFYKPHSGRPEARNRGICESRGQYIAWLDSDDEALPNRIAAQVEAALENGLPDVVSADGFIIRPDGRLQEVRRYETPTPDKLPQRLLAGLAGICPILNTAVMVRRDLYERLGNYDRAYLRCQDYEFWVRVAAATGVRFCHVPHPLVLVHQSPPTPEKLQTILDYYLCLARKMLATFPEERLVDEVAHDLREPASLVIARHLANMAAVFRAPAGHPVHEDVESYLDRAAQEGSPANRAEVWRLRAMLAQSRGEGNLAALYFAKAHEYGGSAAQSSQVTDPVAVQQVAAGGTWCDA